MAAGDRKLVYGSITAATVTLASLATSSTKLVGRQATMINNTSTLALDYIVSGKITTGTSPTAAKSIELWVIGMLDDSIYPDAFGATDAGVTITLTEVKASLLRLLWSTATTNGSSLAYPFTGISLAQAFSGIVPPRFVLFVTHDTGVNLHATAGNHVINTRPIYENVSP